MKFLALLGAASVANAHTLFTTLYIDGKDQGDGTCVRQPANPAKANSPIYPLDGAAMACNENGNNPVNFTCPAESGSKLTFQFRESPSYSQPGAIAEGHKGPCNVYVKKVNDIQSDSAAGNGWFKIWEDGYDEKDQKWCTDRLIDNGGLLSVDIPTGLPSGYYLFRPEILALHNAFDGDPQFYTSCAQVYINNGPDVKLEIPQKYEVSIPGYLKKTDPGLTFNIYEKPMKSYPIPGPEVYIPASSKSGTKVAQKTGKIPSDCVLKNANWCGMPLEKYTNVTGCWASQAGCWKQAKVCWSSAPPSGDANCKVWDDYCTDIDNDCKANRDQYDGPLAFTGKEIIAKSPGACPNPYRTFKTTDVTNNGASGKGDDEKQSSKTDSANKTYSTEKPAENPGTTMYLNVPTKTYPKPEKTASGNTGANGEGDKKPSGIPGTTMYLATPTKTYADAPAHTSASEGHGSGSGGLKVSEDGLCGGSTGQTCVGSKFGDCCSRKGRCGRKTKHCGCGCKKAFGTCGVDE